MEWYPQDSLKLYELLNEFLKNTPYNSQQIHGIIVPHAGYEYSGKTAGKTYSYIKNSIIKKAIILAPTHSLRLRGMAKHNQPLWSTPLRKIRISQEKINAEEIDLTKEYAIGNQIPFLQKLGFREILPLMIGSLTLQEAKEIAEDLSKRKAIIIVSADLSHFNEYEEAVKKDLQTIKIVQDLDFSRINDIDSCALFPLLVTMNLCKINNWKPKLVEYKNSGDVTGNKKSVVGYAGMIF
jgi:AmmeMemoRadiSam system protein B